LLPPPTNNATEFGLEVGVSFGVEIMGFFSHRSEHNVYQNFRFATD
jgi:hypothetical protein